jgi:hypothetical protein
LLPGAPNAGTAIPVVIPTVRDARDVEIGTLYACAINTRDQVTCWGTSHFQPREGPQPAGESAPVAPHGVSELTGVRAVDLGRQIVLCALRPNGDVWAWGSATTQQPAPRPARLEGIANARDVRCTSNDIWWIDAQGAVRVGLARRPFVPATMTLSAP